MKYQRWIAKVIVTLMVFGSGALAAVVPASHATAAPTGAAASCSATTSISGPTKTASGARVSVTFRVNVEGCAGEYWTEYSNIAGPGASDNGRTVTYRGERNYSVTMSVVCRTGTYNVYLQMIGESWDAFRETSRYIRC